MKLKRTMRRIMCLRCQKQVGWLSDIIFESDFGNNTLGMKIYCVNCINEVKNGR